MNEIPSVDKWHRWADGNVTCWWCCATVHPGVVDAHDTWHRRLEPDGPILEAWLHP